VRVRRSKGWEGCLEILQIQIYPRSKRKISRGYMRGQAAWEAMLKRRVIGVFLGLNGEIWRIRNWAKISRSQSARRMRIVMKASTNYLSADLIWNLFGGTDGQLWHSSSESSQGSNLIYLLTISFTQFIVGTPKVTPLCKTAHVSLLHVAEFDQASISPISLDGLYMYAYYTLQ
jgi:hypothetical protein